MRNPTVIPRSGGLHWAWPGFLSKVVKPSQAGAGARESGRIRDRACAVGVIALVLLTVVFGASLVAWEISHFTPANAAPATHLALQSSDPGSTEPAGASGEMASGRAGVDPMALTLWSMPVNLLIFVALGLYLRWDSHRKS
jgi:hypothetical protein